MTAASSPLSTANGVDFMRGRLTAALSTYRIWPVLILLLAGAALASGGIFLRPSNLVAILFVAGAYDDCSARPNARDHDSRNRLVGGRGLGLIGGDRRATR